MLMTQIGLKFITPYFWVIYAEFHNFFDSTDQAVKLTPAKIFCSSNILYFLNFLNFFQLFTPSYSILGACLPSHIFSYKSHQNSLEEVLFDLISSLGIQK